MKAGFKRFINYLPTLFAVLNPDLAYAFLEVLFPWVLVPGHIRH